MEVLRTTLVLLTICGCWRPSTWTLPWKKIMYNAYRIFVIVIVFSFTYSQLMDLILNVENQDEFCETFYIFLAMFISCLKMMNLLVKRRKIGTLKDILESKTCIPEDAEETMIRTKFDKIIHFNTICYIVLAEGSVFCMALTGLFLDFGKRQLTYRGWIPYDYSSFFLFTLTYLHQLIGFTLASFSHIACDCIVCGFLAHTCCQMEILEYRLKNVEKKGPEALKACAHHHDRIYRFAEALNKDFQTIIFIQFLASTLVVCFNLYQFAKSEGINAKLLQLLVYMICMLTQIFIYCWYGNEVKLKSLEISNAAFGFDWTSLNNDSKKILLIIMGRASIPIEFTSAYVVSMNLDSFVQILKTSYSAYNMLQQSEK